MLFERYPASHPSPNAAASPLHSVAAAGFAKAASSYPLVF